MKTWLISLLVSPLAVVLAEAPPLLLGERFNDGSILLENGAELVGGVSGLPEDRAYFAETSGYKKGTRGPVALTAVVNELYQGHAMTVALWYKARQPAEDLGALLLGYGWGVNALSESIRVWLYQSREVNARFHSQGGPWDETEWVFLVMTWSNAERRAAFYRGSAQSAAAIVGEARLRDFPEGLTIEADSKVSIGNNYVNFQAPFDGSIDNVRFYSRVLTDAEMEVIRLADMKNTEPVFTP